MVFSWKEEEVDEEVVGLRFLTVLTVRLHELSGLQSTYNYTWYGSIVSSVISGSRLTELRSALTQAHGPSATLDLTF